jgi:NAD(P)-dependent dehydrogenase (short-subunit alcohol dehydrogenase family)
MNSVLASVYGLDGKVAVVTGGASGIGLATTNLLTNAGARVVVADLSREGCAEVERTLLSANGGFAVETDVASGESVSALFAEIDRRLGRVDVLVNGAALRSKTDFLEMTTEQWDAMFAVCTRGTFLCTREAIRRMSENGGGSIVNISSVGASHTTIFQNAHYDAAKAGVDSLTRSCAVEFAPQGIRVNSIQPGTTRTPGAQRIRSAFAPGGPIRQDGRVLLDRRAEPEELAAAIVFLAGPGASYITGQILAVDGGYSVG